MSSWPCPSPTSPHLPTSDLAPSWSLRGPGNPQSSLGEYVLQSEKAWGQGTSSVCFFFFNTYLL